MNKRKIMTGLVLSLALTASLGINAGAYEYGHFPTYMNGDYNFPLIHGNSGVGTFWI